MTIAELIEILKAFPAEFEVVVEGYETGFDPIYLVKQAERHFGPHAEWFWDVERSGGGVFMDHRRRNQTRAGHRRRRGRAYGLGR